MPKIEIPGSYRRGGKSVVGIDPSLTAAAVCVDGTKMVVLAAGPPHKSLHNRLARWNAHVENIVREIPTDVRLIVIEGYSFGSKGQATLDIAEFGILLRVRLLEIAVTVEVAPSMLKKFITGKGNATKLQMAAAIIRCSDAEYATDDEYDAHGLWMLGEALLDKSKCRTDFQRAIIIQLGGA